MARVLGLEDVASELRSAIASALRLTDEAIVLPSASRSDESGSYKNIVFKLRGDEENLSSEQLASSPTASMVALRTVSHPRASHRMGCAGFPFLLAGHPGNTTCRFGQQRTHAMRPHR